MSARLGGLVVLLCCAVVCGAWGVAPAQAGTMTLAWEAVTTQENGEPLTTLGGYTIYYGEASGVYTAQVDVGDVTQVTLEELPEDVPLYFVATAYTTDGLESAYSNEVSGIATPTPPEPLGPCANQPGAYVQTSLPVVPVKARVALYRDKSQPVLKTVPSLLKGACLVQTRWADRNSRAPALVTLQMQADATVYLGYDERPGPPPRWLTEHYDALGVRLAISNTKARMLLWGIPVQAGYTLTIPGTQYQRAASGGLPYAIFVQGEQP